MDVPIITELKFYITNVEQSSGKKTTLITDQKLIRTFILVKESTVINQLHILVI